MAEQELDFVEGEAALVQPGSRRRVTEEMRVYVAGDNGEPRPTKKGICVRLEDLPKLREAIDALKNF